MSKFNEMDEVVDMNGDQEATLFPETENEKKSGCASY